MIFHGHLPPQHIKHFVGSIARTEVLDSGGEGYLSFRISEVNRFRDTDDQKAVAVTLDHRVPFARCHTELRRQIKIAD